MPFPSKPPPKTLLRTLTTTASSPKPPPNRYHNTIPPYPHGPSLTYKTSNSGLYGASHIQFGNLISHQNELKSRRTWHPNIHRKRLWSDSLQRFIRVKVQARVLRTIDKVGGLDEYLLGDKPARIRELGVQGWRLRWLVMRTPKIRARIREERVRLGLPPGGWMESVGVEEVVEKVGGEIVGEMDGRDADEMEDEESRRGGTMQEQVENYLDDIERKYTIPTVETGKFVEERESADLVRIAESKAEESGKDSPEVVQANDSRSMAGKAFGRLRGLFGR